MSALHALKARRQASRTTRSLDRAMARAMTPAAQHELFVLASRAR